MIGIRYGTLMEAMLAAPADLRFLTMWHDEDEIDIVTFGEFIRLAQLQAADFVNYGIESGDTVVLVMPQGIPLMTAFAAAMLVGAVPSIMAYPNFKVEPAKYRFGLAGVSKNLKARLVVVDEDFPDELLSYVAIEGDARIVRAATPDSNETAIFSPVVASDSNSVAFIQHSAGTTGLQKGVALTHAAVLTQLGHLSTALKLNENDRIYSWLPLYHDMGLIACFMLPLVYHLPVVMQSSTDWVMRPGSMLSLITEHRCTIGWIPNFALQFLARRVPKRDRSQFSLSSMRMLINCSEPVRKQSIDEFCSAFAECGFAPQAHQASYAMAENVFALTQSGMDSMTGPRVILVDGGRLTEQHIAELVPKGWPGALPLVSSGRCLPGNQFRIANADDHDLPDGHVGEIILRSDSMFEGYYNRPDLTEKVLRDGWYWSGDLGFSIEGDLFVIGRKSDLIIVAGKNLYPQDIEEIACSHPGIHDGRAVAFGVVNTGLGTEEIFIVAEVEDESMLEQAASIENMIRNAVVAELGVTVRAVYIKPPKWIVKSTAGKPARSTTRTKLVAEHPELHRD